MRAAPVLVLLGALAAACADELPPGEVAEAPAVVESRGAAGSADAGIRIDRGGGLSIEVQREGDGPVVQSGDRVTLHCLARAVAPAPAPTASAAPAPAEVAPAPTEEAAEPPAEAPVEPAPAPEAAAAPEPVVIADTRASGVPLSVELRRGRLIEGLRRGLEGLRVGTHAVLQVPSSLAYGEAGMAAAGVPPGADLVYEVEILSAARADGRR